MFTVGCGNRLKRFIITDYIESSNGVKSVCRVYVKCQRLSRNNASQGRYAQAQKQCEKYLLNADCTYICIITIIAISKLTGFMPLSWPSVTPVLGLWFISVLLYKRRDDGNLGPVVQN